MKHLTIRRTLLVVATLWSLPTWGQWQPVANGSFEEGSAQPPPTATGFWGGDEAAFVEETLSIAPLDGGRMLQFISTTPTGPSLSDIGSTTAQFLEINGDVSSGQVGIAVTAHFNRVAGDPETDRRFILRVSAFDTDPSKGTPEEGAGIGSGAAMLFTDDDPATWEPITATLCVPAETVFISVTVAAVEDIMNDDSSPEFDGHFCDLVTCESFTVETEFLRGDCNQDGVLTVADPITLLLALFVVQGGEDLPCEDACDSDDDGEVALMEIFAMLETLFGGGPLPAAPFPDCGIDATPDGLCCDLASCP